MSLYETTLSALRASPKTWLVTGAAGFIGSNLVEALLRHDQRVVGFDNFDTGYRHNLEHVRAAVSKPQAARFSFIEGDIRHLRLCQDACRGADYVLHQAALGSVPRSIEEPLNSHEANVTGFVNMLLAARDHKVQRFVYASSSAVYGDHPGLPKGEDHIGAQLSPYAGTKLMNEIYAGIFARCYGTQAIGLRYFNVFGARQDPEGAYAAVIPKWVSAILHGEPVYINGDGETSRDFCYIANVVQANILAATAAKPEALNQAYNVAAGQLTTLNQLFGCLREKIKTSLTGKAIPDPIYREFRAGDVRHSVADIGKAANLLGYAPTHDLALGLDEALEWYAKNLSFPGKAPGVRQASGASGGN